MLCKLAPLLYHASQPLDAGCMLSLKSHQAVYTSVHKAKGCHGAMQQQQRTSPQQQQSSHGCLITALIFVLFGWIGLLVAGVWRLTRWLLHAAVAPLRWTWQATRALTVWSWRGSQALSARYGWRGWAVVGVVVVALAILETVLTHTQLGGH